MDELERLVAERPPSVVPTAERAAEARSALVAYVDSAPAHVRPAPRSRVLVGSLAAAAAVLVAVMVGAGLLVSRSDSGDAPVSTQVAFDLPPVTAEVGAAYTFAFTPSPDLRPDPDEPPTAGVGVGPSPPLALVATDQPETFEVSEPGGGPSDAATVEQLTGGQAPFALEPPTEAVSPGDSWRYAAAPLVTGGQTLDGTCDATLRSVDTGGRSTADVQCDWGAGGAGEPVATSVERWTVEADGELVEWTQTLTPTPVQGAPAQPGTTTLTRR